MLTALNKSYLIITIQTILGIIFIFSGTLKLTDLNKFADALANFKLFSDSLINFLKFVIPIIELILGISIIFNFNSSIPSFIASLMLSFFTALIVVKLFEGEETSCGCFGALSSDKLDILSIFRNFVLILFAIIISTYYEEINVKKQARSGWKQ